MPCFMCGDVDMRPLVCGTPHGPCGRPIVLALCCVIATGGAYGQPSIKDRLKEATAAPRAARAGASTGYLAAEPAGLCPFLTKPSVRSDGGGLNRHAEGQFLCFRGLAMNCDAGVWRSRGSCDPYNIEQAWRIEGTEPERTSKEDMNADLPSAGSARGAGLATPSSEDDDDSGAGGMLLRDDGRSVDEIGLKRRDDDGALGAAATSRAQGNDPATEARPRAGPAQCQHWRSGLAQSLEQKRVIEQASRSEYSGPGVGPTWRDAHAKLVQYINMLQKQIGEVCR